VWIALSTVYVVWGSTYLAIRIGVRTIPPFLMGGVRFMLAGALLYAWDRWHTRSKRAVTRASNGLAPYGLAPYGRERARFAWLRPWGATFLIGGLLLLGGNGGVMWGEAHHVPSGVAALIFATLPMWMALLTFLLYRERLSAAVIGGLVLGFAGIVLLVGGVSGGQGGLAGPLVVLGGAVYWSLGSVLTRWAPLPSRQTRSTALQMMCGGLLLILAGVLSGELSQLHLSRVSTASWLAFAYLVLVGSLVGFTAYAWLLSHARISLVSTYAYVNPVVALFLGWALASETLTARTFMASAIVIVAVAIIVSARSRSTGAEPSPADEGKELVHAEHP
jgi:drug/metabolite transporter (DMT)-like permease